MAATATGKQEGRGSFSAIKAYYRAAESLHIYIFIYKNIKKYGEGRTWAFFFLMRCLLKLERGALNVYQRGIKKTRQQGAALLGAGRVGPRTR